MGLESLNYYENGLACWFIRPKNKIFTIYGPKFVSINIPHAVGDISWENVMRGIFHYTQKLDKMIPITFFFFSCLYQEEYEVDPIFPSYNAIMNVI